jgi:DNA-binding IclR family transcriptional regulator
VTARPTTPAGQAESQLRRGLRVLDELAVEPQSAADVARTLGINRSTALRLLGELEQSGYVTRDAATKRYANVFERLYGLVASHNDHWDWIELIHPVLSSLRDAFGEAAVQAVPASGSMVYIAFFPSVHPIAVRERLGTVRPMHCSALGKAFLSGLEADDLDRELGRLNYGGGTSRAAGGPLELRRQVEESRVQGFALDLEETFDGVACVAAPTRVAGLLVGAAGVSGPASRLSRKRLEEIGRVLVDRLAAVERG